MLTIQCTLLPRLIEITAGLSNLETVILYAILIISLIFFLVSLLIFMSTLNNFNEIQTVPDIDVLVDFDFNNVPFNNIIAELLINLKECVKDNDQILDEKNSKGYLGFNLMKCGVISTVMFIIYVLLIII